MTVAPQNDICLQGSTYPINAVMNSRRRIEMPDIQVCKRLKELKNMFRPMCM